tara:strand:- start:158 stop:532 length:375 start_codon:yes stop_codon:yes gene_type:complete
MQPEQTESKVGRVRRLYKRQLDGLSSTALVYDHAEKEQVSVQTAWRDWAEVKKIVDEDWQADRENMLARLQHMRTKLFHQALKKGQLQTASQVLDSIGKVIGESVETVNIQAPELKISIQNKDD